MEHYILDIDRHISKRRIPKMKAVAFNGSPRKGGNTELLLKKVLEPISKAGIETELIQIGGKQIRGCIACYKCRENKDSKCSITTDMVNECIAKMIEADAIILGSPTYFAGMTSDMKALIDRAGFVAGSNGRLFSRKIGAAVVVNRRGGATNVLDSINHMFLISRMIVPGSTYWNFGVGREKGEVEKDTEGLENMKDLGETIAWLVKSLHPAQGA
jgi:multimeric flavodoxin WrbA